MDQTTFGSATSQNYNNNNNLTCKAPVCAKKTSVALKRQVTNFHSVSHKILHP